MCVRCAPRIDLTASIEFYLRESTTHTHTMLPRIAAETNFSSEWHVVCAGRPRLVRQHHILRINEINRKSKAGFSLTLRTILPSCGSVCCALSVCFNEKCTCPSSTSDKTLTGTLFKVIVYFTVDMETALKNGIFYAQTFLQTLHYTVSSCIFITWREPGAGWF